jgi:hypothetical protein
MTDFFECLRWIPDENGIVTFVRVNITQKLADGVLTPLQPSGGSHNEAEKSLDTDWGFAVAEEAW